MNKYISLFGFWVLIFTQSANGFNLNSDDTYVYANETIIDSTLTDSGLLRIESAANELYLQFDFGFSLTNRGKFIRIDLTNAEFDLTLPSTGLPVSGDYESWLVAGGAVNDNFAIIEIRATSILTADALISVEVDSLLVNDYSQAVYVSYQLYDKVTSALSNTSAIVSLEKKLAQFTNGFAQYFAQTFRHSADIQQNFLRFVPTYRSPANFELGDATENLAVLAKFYPDRLIADGVRDVTTSQLITDYSRIIPNQITGAKTALLQGDFQKSTFFLNEDDDCTGVSLELEDTDELNEIAISLDELQQYPVFCVEADSNETTIQKSEYFLDINLGADVAPFGQIYYDAAYFDLPYLTDTSDFNQRLTMVNNSEKSMDYTMVFTSEESVIERYIVSELSQGTIPPNTSISLSIAELVEIDANVPSRLNARVYASGHKEDLAVAVQIFAQSSGSSIPPLTNIIPVYQPQL